MLGDGLALLGMPDIEMLDILKIMCEVMGGPHKSRMVSSQTMQASNGPSCKANKVQHIKTGYTDANNTNSNTPNYLRSSLNIAADKRASKVLRNKCTMNLVMFFRNWMFWRHI